MLGAVLDYHRHVFDEEAPRVHPRQCQALLRLGQMVGLRFLKPESIRYEATVYVEGLTGDIAGSWRCQEYDHGRDVLGFVGASQGYVFYVAPFDLLGADALFLRDRRHQIEVEVGAHNARAHGVDVDIVGAQLLRRRFRQADDGALARGIDGIGGARETLAGDRSNIDHASTAVRDHFSSHPLQAEEHALCVHAMDVIPVSFSEIHNVGAAGNTCVVDENVNLAEDGNRLGH